MARFVFGMMQSLDGYVDDVARGLVLPAPGPALGRLFTCHVRRLAGSLSYGFGFAFRGVLALLSVLLPPDDDPSLPRDFSAVRSVPPCGAT